MSLKRLVEVAFPLEQVSLDSVHEKNVRHGHISTLHIWPARRPLAASRAALIATLLPDPGNARERQAVYRRMAGEVVETVEDERVGGRTVARRRRETQDGILHWKREGGPDVEWFRARVRDAFGGRAPRVLDPFAGGGAIPLEAMRLGCAVTAVDINPVAWFILKCTLDYPRRLAGETRPLPAFALRDRVFMTALLKARGVKGRALKRELAELCLGDDRETEPRLIGTGPALEADLAWQVRAWGRRVLAETRRRLARRYPTYAAFQALKPGGPRFVPRPLTLLAADANGDTDVGPLNAEFDAVYLKDRRNPRWVAKPAVAYLWARTARCKGCRATVPLLKTCWLARKGAKRVRLTMAANADETGVVFGVESDVPRGEGNPARRREHDRRVGAGTMSRSGVRCPLCQAIMTMQDLRLDGRAGRLGEVMTAVVVDGPHGKEYRLPTEHELQAEQVKPPELDALYADIPFGLPDEPTPKAGVGASRAFSVDGYGFDRWRTLFTNRQLLALGTLVQEMRRLPETMAGWPDAWREAVVASLTPTISRVADRGSTLATWTNDPEKVRSTFARFALPMVWDFVEACPLTDTSGGFNQAIEWTAEVCEHLLDATTGAPTPAVLRRSAAEPQPTASPGARPPVVTSDRTPERADDPQATTEPGLRSFRNDSAGVPGAVGAPAVAAAATEPQATSTQQRLSPAGSTGTPGSATEPQAHAEDAGFDLICTDPPYYDAIPYSDLMDFFHVWLRRALWGLSPEIDAAFEAPLGPKWNAAANDGELIDDAARFGGDRGASKRNYEDGMARAFSRFHAALRDEGRLVIVFANKSPDAWETLVSALIRAGFVVVGSWPIQTERLARTRAMQSAALASSIWIVCRKRPPARAGWDAAVLAEMRENITRQLRDFWVAGIRGPDFVWAATGPALEAFSKHPVVKKADAPGERLAVSEFLREVRRFVVDFVVGRVLTHDGDTQATSGLDDVTTYYLLHRNDFGMGDAPAGACILYALSCNLSDRELTDRYDVLSRGRRPSVGEAGHEDADSDEDAGPVDGSASTDRTGSTDSAGSTNGPGGAGSRVALKPWSRRTARSLGLPAPDGRQPPLIDQAHRLMHLWRAGEEARVNDYLDDRGLKRHALFARLLQALIELADASSDERAILESLSNHVAARAGLAPPRQPKLQRLGENHDHLA